MLTENWTSTSVRLLCGKSDAAGSLDFVLLFFVFTPSKPGGWSELGGTGF